jgi:nucleotide-binding universal stress UspA family protein/hemerythrin-like domain-containing protein
MYRHLLVALDDTPLSTEAASRSVALARAVGARVTFFHAYMVEGASSTGAPERMISPATLSEATAGSVRTLFARAEAVAREASVPYTSLTVRSDRPHEAILDAAETQGCDLVCMASHGPAGIKGLMLGSQTQKVLQHTTIPVLVSVVESNISRPEHVNPVSVIRGEHRSLAIVIRGLEYLVRERRERQTQPRFTLLRAMLYYITAFPEKLHHPKEDAYLFRKLRERTSEFNDAIDQLEHQHVEGHILVNDLEQSLARYEADPAKGFAGFGTAVQRFAAMQWQHMSLEQKVIIPAAQKHLTTEDWADIERAFAENGDPRFSAGADEEFKQLFADILELAPKRIFDGASERSI